MQRHIVLFATIFVIVSFFMAVPYAQAAIPTYQGKGTFTSGTGALSSVPVPAGYVDNDVFFLFVESANQAIAVPAGWTQVTNSPQFTGSAATAGGVRLAVFYKVVFGVQSNVSVADSGNHTTAIIVNFRGVDASSPIHLTAGSINSSATSNLSAPSLITTVADTLIVNAIGLDKDLADIDTLSGEVNINLANLTERHDQTISAGVGGGIAFYTGEKAATGSTGNTTTTGDSATTHAYITIALKPEPPPSNQVTVNTALTQPTNVTEGAAGVVMGAFTFISSASSATVNSIKISEKGSVNANANLANVKLYAQQESVCSFAGSTQIGTTQSFTATDDATFNTLGLSVGTVTQQCVFVVLDVGASAGGGNTIEIEISVSGDVSVTGGAPAGSFPVQISGTSAIRADSGTIMSSEVDFNWVSGQPSWGEILWTTTETEGDVKLRVYYTVSTACDTIVPDSAIAGNSAGFDALASPLDISGLNTATYNRVCLQATLTAGASMSPTLNSWAVTWVPPGGIGTFNQSAYRFFQNENGTNVATALMPQNTPAVLTGVDQAFRLRLLIHRGASELIQNGQSFKLQYAVKAPTCGAYSDVTLATPVTFNDNAIPVDGNALTANGSLDPTHASDMVVPETYEELNNFTNAAAAIPAGQDGLWDFSLRTNSAPSGATYCFRVVRSDNSVLDTYTVTPEIISATLYVTSGMYISNAFDTGAARSFHVISWTTSKTNAACGACIIKVQIKTSPDGVTWSPTWAGFEGELDGDETDYYTVSAGQLIHTDHNGDRWIRYRATLDGDATASPVLEEIKINYRN